MTTDVPPRRLQVHVLNAGVGEGESIVLKLPDGKWGVVDCYARSLSDRATNPTLAFLQQHGAAELEFLCLTHPHDDHFRGMSHILNAYPIRYFWRFGGMSAKDLNRLVEYFVVQAEQGGEPTENENADELRCILSLVEKKRRARKRGIRQKRAHTGQQLYPVPVDPNAEFQVWSLAPSGDQVARYENQLKHCFTESGRIKRQLAHSRHNIVSVALGIIFGNTRVVLGGDVEEAGWRDVIREWGAQALASQAVKASHHGSTNGYCDGLWKHFAARGRPVVIITPYHKFGLPKSAAVNHIRRYADRLLSTCTPAAVAKESGAKRRSASPLKSQLAVRRQFKTVPAVASGAFGRCTLVFDNAGGLVDESLEPPAVQLVPSGHPPPVQRPDGEPPGAASPSRRSPT